MLIPQESGEALELLAQDVGGVLPVALPLDVFVGSLGDLVVPGAHVLEAGAAGGREVYEDVRERTYPRGPAAVGAFLLCYVRDSELVMVAPADFAFQVEEGDEVENPALLQSLDGVLDAAHPILAGLFDEPVLAFSLSLLLDLLELLHNLAFGRVGGDPPLCDDLLSYRLWERVPELGGPLLGTGDDKVLGVVPAHKLLCSLARLLEKAVYVRLLRAAGRVHVRRTATHRIETFGLEVHLPEVAAARALAALVGVSH